MIDRARLHSAVVGRAQVFRRQADFRLRGRHVSRDQWGDDTSYVEECWDLYRRQMDDDRATIERNSPMYAARLAATLRHVTGGRVLEIGAGIGTMTRWIVEQPGVEEVVAVEAFDDAAKALTDYELPKVTVHHADVTALDLDGSFDVVLACEIIEHLYAHEEAAMFEHLRNHVTSRTRYVVSVPVGYMPDDFHVRGFTPRRLRRHLEHLYGPVEGVEQIGSYSQVAWGHFR